MEEIMFSRNYIDRVIRILQELEEEGQIEVRHEEGRRETIVRFERNPIGELVVWIE